ncbi:MAG: signal peptidase I [Propionibacteriaceae bacterium]|nr:signal peptidase I [Propionibacteriaceae bacterium]
MDEELDDSASSGHFYLFGAGPGPEEPQPPVEQQFLAPPPNSPDVVASGMAPADDFASFPASPLATSAPLAPAAHSFLAAAPGTAELSAATAFGGDQNFLADPAFAADSAFAPSPAFAADPAFAAEPTFAPITPVEAASDPIVAAEPQQAESPDAEQLAKPGKKRKKRDKAGKAEKAKPEKPKRTGLQIFGSWAREIAIVMVGALIASTLLRMFVVQLYEIPSGSMENLIRRDDRVAVQKLTGFSRGDVVVFRDTQNWLHETPKEYGWWTGALVFVGLAPDESVGYLIKRVIGMPGDRVSCCDAQGRVTINGTPLQEDTYLYQDPVTGQLVDPSISSFDVIVPEGRVFVLGDHRNSSMDSRCHLPDPTNGGPPGIMGFVPVENVVGTAIARVYPFSRFMGISRPSSFDQIPAPTEPPPPDPVIYGEIQPCVNG